MSVGGRRSARLARYAQLRDERPHLFVNPPGAAYEILFDRADQDDVADEAAEKLRARGLPEEYGDIGVVYEDPYFILLRDAVRFRSGKRGAYVRVFGADPGTNAAVLPLFSDGRVLLVRHFRHGTRGWHWEIPRGFAEPGADGAATARQELVEEVGIRVDDVRLLGSVFADADPDEIYLASIDAAVAPSIDGAVEEGIDELRLVSLAEFRMLIANGEIIDMYALAAFALATAKGLIKP